MVNCTLCGREAVVELNYNGFSLCEGCFVRQFEKRVRKAIRMSGFLKRGKRIAVGVSGGKDSAAVLAVLSKFNSKIGAVLLPVLIDEGIKGYRNKAKLQAEKLCSSLNLKLNVYTFKELFGFDLDKVMKLNPKREACAYCGVWRRWALNKAAIVDLNADFLVVGHNADDVAQSFLMNLMRNSSLTLSRSGGVETGKKKKLFSTRVKPLIFNLEKESAIYCFLKEIPFYLGECPHYNGFRMKVKDFLNEMESVYPGSKFALSNASLSIQKSLPSDKRKIFNCSSCGFYSSTSKCMACTLKEEVQEYKRQSGSSFRI
ncbi:MAG: adenine nucleotide alpha hydrolase family protein [Candidatus Marsarchaeota archaeon]|nr:adenine nucleotide alpha hydrolase family protein [Candidatus Marsarchaeota archaeon]